MVWGRWLDCGVCRAKAMDIHHTCQRGNKKNNEDRKIHSSVFNSIPLCRDHHEGNLHSIDKRQFFLDIARKRIENSLYSPTITDKKFIWKFESHYPEGYEETIFQ